MPQRIAVHGAAGRMGRRVVALATADLRFECVAAIDRADGPNQGQDAGALAGIEPLGVSVSDHWPSDVDVVIDFSLPSAIEALAARCADSGWPLVVATTGLEQAQKDHLAAAAARIPIVWSPSMSLAVNLTMRLAEQAAAALRHVPGGVDIEIIERHHRFKEDAPSGTALRFGQLIAEAAGGDMSEVHGREGRTGARSTNEIGYHAIRAGDNPGEHTIVFGMLGETVELRVAASNRDCYAAGALTAAAWLAGKPAGMYSMFDVLGTT